MAASVAITWMGVQQLALRLAAARAVAPIRLGAALYKEGQAILADAIPLTPIEFGNLRASGHVDSPKLSGDTAEVVIGFGGAAAPYAIYVHERLDLVHRSPTQAKFLEMPVLARRADFAQRLHVELVI